MLQTALRAVLAISACLLCPSLAAQETRVGEEGFESPPASLTEIDWLVGQWTGDGIGGAPAMESWLPPTGGTMVGTFVQQSSEGGIQFTEHLYLMEEDGSLVLRLKHFNEDLTGWEEKDDMLTFRLVAIEPCALYFNALTLRCDGTLDGKRGLLAAVRMQSGSELIFRFRLAGTPSAARALCGTTRTDVEAVACVTAIADRATTRREEYRDAALARYAENPSVTAAILANEEAYSLYVARECSSWAQRVNILPAMQENSCRLKLEDIRTVRLWENWLAPNAVYDSGLPEPQPTR